MKCKHCKKELMQGLEWTLSVCADRNKQRVRLLCLSCDVKLNRYILKFFNDPNTEKKIAAYEQRIRARISLGRTKKKAR